MGRSPSIVPQVADQDIYLVLDDFGGRIGRTWREVAEEDTGRTTLIADLLKGQYSNPARVIAFNAAEGWSRDVTDDIAEELRQRCSDLDEVPETLQEFLDSHAANDCPSRSDSD